MLKFGYITNYDDCGRVVVQIQDEDGVTTDYIPIARTSASKDSTGDTIDTATLVAVVLDDENPSSGVCLGAVGVMPRENVNKTYHKFSDGTVLEYDRVTHILNADVKGEINATAEKTTLNSPLDVTDNINSTKDISDHKGTMQAIRDAFNNHTHSNGNNGANTGVPTQKL